MGIKATLTGSESSKKAHRCWLGGVAERSNAAVLKCEPAAAPSGTEPHSRQKTGAVSARTCIARHPAATALPSNGRGRAVQRPRPQLQIPSSSFELAQREAENKAHHAIVTSIDARAARPSRMRPPATVWILTVLMALRAFVSVVGSFLFAFPVGGLVGTIAGSLLVAAGIGYAIIAWRLRLGERSMWIAALVLPVVHQAGLATLDLMQSGRISSHDYPFIAMALLIVILLLLPTTRRFFTR